MKDFDDKGLPEKVVILKLTPPGVHDPGAIRKQKARLKTVYYDAKGKKTLVELHYDKNYRYNYHIFRDKIIRYDSTGARTVEKKVSRTFR